MHLKNLTNWLHDGAECLSLAITFPTIFFGLTVVILFWKDAIYAFKSRSRSKIDCLVLGIFIGFFGGVLDNTYWAIPWTLDFIDHPSSNWWFRQGVYYNIFSRQLCGWTAAYFHVRAALWPAETGNSKRFIENIERGRQFVKRLAQISALSALAHLGTLFLIRFYSVG